MTKTRCGCPAEHGMSKKLGIPCRRCQELTVLNVIIGVIVGVFLAMGAYAIWGP